MALLVQPFADDRVEVLRAQERFGLAGALARDLQPQAGRMIDRRSRLDARRGPSRGSSSSGPRGRRSRRSSPRRARLGHDRGRRSSSRDMIMTCSGVRIRRRVSRSLLRRQCAATRPAAQRPRPCGRRSGAMRSRRPARRTVAPAGELPEGRGQLVAVTLGSRCRDDEEIGVVGMGLLEECRDRCGDQVPRWFRGNLVEAIEHEQPRPCP